MKLAKEEKIVAVLLFMALGSLSVAFWAFSPEEGSATGSGLSGSISSFGSDPSASVASSSAFRKASGSAFSSSTPGGQADPGEAGRESVSLAGMITELKRTESGGHLLIRLNSTPLPVFVPAKSGAEELAAVLSEGDAVRVRGILREYQGKEEIEVSRSADVEKVN